MVRSRFPASGSGASPPEEDVPASPRSQRGKRPLEDPTAGPSERRVCPSPAEGQEVGGERTPLSWTPYSGASVYNHSGAARSMFSGMIPETDRDWAGALSSERLMNESFLALGKAAVLLPELIRRLRWAQHDSDHQRARALRLSAALEKAKEEASSAESWKRNLALALEEADAEKAVLRRRVAALEEKCDDLEYELSTMRELYPESSSGSSDSSDNGL